VATSVTFVTGHEDPAKTDSQTDWAALARSGGTIVLYMGVKTLPRIAAALIAGGMPADTPAAAVQWGTHARQRTVTGTVSTLAHAITAAGLGAPVITVIGKVVALREEIAWFDRLPLFGRRIVVTRASAQATGLRDALAARGAEVLEVPALRIEPLEPGPLAGAISRLGEYRWVVMTSQNAVRLAWEALRSAGLDARAFAGVRIACVGRATNDALLAHGLAADVVPERYVAEGVLEAMAQRQDVRGTRVLYVAAEDAREVLPAGLRALGCTVDRVAAYRAVADGVGAESLRDGLSRGEVDLVTFASASAVRGYVEAVGAARATRAPAATIGPVTSDAARAAGVRVVAEAREASIAGIVAAVEELFVGREGKH
jgi:uroporphyrinogen III methyltransferase/synthase